MRLRGKGEKYRRHDERKGRCESNGKNNEYMRMHVYVCSDVLGDTPRSTSKHMKQCGALLATVAAAVVEKWRSTGATNGQSDAFRICIFYPLYIMYPVSRTLVSPCRR